MIDIDRNRTAGLALTPPAPLSQLWERGEDPEQIPLRTCWETRQRLGGEGRFRGVRLFPFGHKTDRTVYAHQQVRMALEKLFHEKCAYCESELKNVVWDIEHFRPKGRVAERPNHPGYYWLAPP